MWSRRAITAVLLLLASWPVSADECGDLARKWYYTTDVLIERGDLENLNEAAERANETLLAAIEKLKLELGRYARIINGDARTPFKLHTAERTIKVFGDAFVANQAVLDAQFSISTEALRQLSIAQELLAIASTARGAGCWR